ncbi:uncharacterized protein LOC123559434 [Mercenaria mercenaria]|uniref:uncharacterized protein LOC123559434 n=1 Tax=Mercenaria mercenaria TaxID=6596 RepID=UPI00234E4E6F|nr:uncharacterized protein LOC123559434 [Mercenaria mercenaria]
MILTVYGGIFMNLFVSALEASEGTCSEWKLSGGSSWYEGIVEVFYNQSWANICADSFTYEDAEEVCDMIFKKGENILEETILYESNVYRAVVQSRNISYKMCGNHGQEGKTTNRKCRKVAILCCVDRSTDSCSSNWTSTLNMEYMIRRGREHLRYDHLLQVNFTNMNIIKSWTKSALEEQTCDRSVSTNDSAIGMAKNCSNKCLVTSDLIFIMFSADNITCCLRNSSNQTLQNEDCAIRKLSIVNRPTDNVTSCLAAEVINGSVYVSIEDCSRFFKAFNVSKYIGKVYYSDFIYILLFIRLLKTTW